MAAASNQNVAEGWEKYKDRLRTSNDPETNHWLTNDNFLDRKWKQFVKEFVDHEQWEIENKMQRLKIYIDPDSDDYATEYAKLNAQLIALTPKYKKLISNGRPNAKEPGMLGFIRERAAAMPCSQRNADRACPGPSAIQQRAPGHATAGAGPQHSA